MKQRRRPGGMALIAVLVAAGIFITLTAGTFCLTRPAGDVLDLHLDIARANDLVESHLQEALERLDRDHSAAVDPSGPDKRVLNLAAKLPSRGGSAKTVSAGLTATVRRTAAGWRVQDFSLTAVNRN